MEQLGLCPKILDLSQSCTCVAVLFQPCFPIILDVDFLLLGEVPRRWCVFGVEGEEGTRESYVVLVAFVALLVPFVLQGGLRRSPRCGAGREHVGG